MGGGRKKPFGGKKKKQQLIEKRRKKREKGARTYGAEADKEHARGKQEEEELKRAQGDEEQESDVSEEAKEEKKEKEEKNALPGRGRLISRFLEDASRDSVEERKRLAREPLAGGLCAIESQAYAWEEFPTRPPWSSDDSAQQLEEREKRAVAEWHRGLQLKERTGRYNHYELNHSVWQQLWRVVDISDVLAIVLDARWPLLQLPTPLVRHVRRRDKPLVLVLNKCDLVPKEVLSAWRKYLRASYKHVVEFRAVRLEQKKKKKPRYHLAENPEAARELLDVVRAQIKGDQEFVTLGMIGHPNVGKSSVINSLLGAKKVAVSATPGKTKHLQTHYVEEKVRLCDCPGLVFPAVGPVHLQPITGSYPIDHLKEPFSSVKYLASHYDLVEHYHMELPEGHSAWDICEARGEQMLWHLKGGRIDMYRAAKAILKDALNGRLTGLFTAPPKAPQ